MRNLELAHPLTYGGRPHAHSELNMAKKLEVLAGTSGYSYKEWKGTFYPEDLANDDMLGYYAEQLPTVEINNTFYRMPKSHVVDAWAEAVPTTFRFVLKASRRITHQAKLADAEETIGYLASRAERLEDKLGAVLFQLPPFLRKGTDRLKGFLEAWPKALPAAMEFRHESWFDEEVFDLLRAHQTAIVVSEDDKLPLPSVTATTDWMYLRLRKPRYTAPGMNRWLKEVRAQSVGRAFAFFKHEDAGSGPRAAARFMELAVTPEPKRATRKKAASARGNRTA